MSSVDYFYLFWVFCVGLVTGSFLNVCIVRLPEGESLVFPSSHCRFCGGPIYWRDKIPLLSFLLLGGKCRYCRKSLSVLYPLVEFSSGILAVLSVLKFFPPLQIPILENGTAVLSALFWGLLWFLTFLSPLLVISLIDARFQIIPNAITFPFTGLGFLVHGASNGLTWVALKDSIFGSFIGGASLWLVALLYLKIRKREGMGRGDFKLAAMIGAFLGWQSILVVIFLSSFLGLLWGLLSIARLGKSWQGRIPYGPFLAIAAALVWFFQNLIDAILHP